MSMRFLIQAWRERAARAHRPQAAADAAERYLKALHRELQMLGVPSDIIMSGGAGGVADDEKRARRLARASLLSTSASDVLVEQAFLESGIRVLNYGYVRTGQGWHGHHTPSGRVTWRRFHARESSPRALRPQLLAH